MSFTIPSESEVRQTLRRSEYQQILEDAGMQVLELVCQRIAGRNFQGGKSFAQCLKDVADACLQCYQELPDGALAAVVTSLNDAAEDCITIFVPEGKERQAALDEWRKIYPLR